MEVTLNSAVLAKAGRDKGRFFAVVRLDDRFVWLADGKLRKIESPKKKNAKHVAATSFVLEQSSLKSNKALRTALENRFGAEVRPQP